MVVVRPVKGVCVNEIFCERRGRGGGLTIDNYRVNGKAGITVEERRISISFRFHFLIEYKWLSELKEKRIIRLEEIDKCI